jgi:hypothetical protein
MRLWWVPATLRGYRASWLGADALAGLTLVAGGSAGADGHCPAGGHADGCRAPCLRRRIARLRPARHKPPAIGRRGLHDSAGAGSVRSARTLYQLRPVRQGAAPDSEFAARFDAAARSATYAAAS